jgi:Protein of unknown function (DUF4038)
VAVGFDAVGPGAAGATSAGATTLSWSHTVGASGTYLLVGATCDVGTDTGFSLTAKYNGVAMTSLGVVHTNNSTVGFLQVWGMANPPTGSALTVLITAAGGTPTDLNGGSLSFTGAGSLSAIQTGANTGTTASLAFTPTVTGNMVAAFCGCGSPLTAGGSFTGRYTTAGAGGAGAGFAAGSTLASTGSSVTPSWTIGGTDFWAIIAVEVKVLPTAPPSPPAPVPQIPPGWFPGSAAVIQDPGGIPFYSEPPPTDATPAVIFPAFPEAAPPPLPLLPPGWFPGADKAATEPGGIPFYAQPLPVTEPGAVIFPVPEVAGEVQWLPWPPNYFPGSQAVSVDPGGIPFYSQPQPLTPPPAPPPVPVITTLAGSGAAGYFADQNGKPRLGLADNPWGLIPNAGRWSGGWQSTLDAYFSARGAQGFTAVYLDPYGNTVNGGAFADGRTWDGVYPFNSGSTNDPSSGLNDAFFARVDYAIASAATYGIAVLLNIGYVEGATADMGGTGCLAGKTTQQYTDYGTFLAARYKNTANLMWVVGNDYFDSFQAEFTAMKTGLRGGGANQPFMVHNMPESTARRTLDTNAVLTTGTALSDVSFVYTYNCGYFGIEQAYAESSPLPVILGDGYFYASSSNTYTATLDRAARQEVWWVLASGARFYNFGSEGIWQWTSGAAAQVTGEYFYTTQAGIIRAAVEGLPGWHKLIPDTASQLVTAGRGTRATSLANGGGGGQYEPAFTNSYAAASRTPDGSLALIYMPAATTITVSQALLGAGYTATWIDPVSGATSAGTPGATYNSTAQGSNSAGDPDWVLALQGPPAAAAGMPGLPDWLPQPPGWFPGADRVTDLPGGIPFYVIPQPADQVAGPAGAVFTGTASAAGAGAVTAVVTQIAPAAAAGAGAVAAVVTEVATGAAAGAGVTSAVVTQIAPATAAGAGAVTAVATQDAGTSTAAAGAAAVTDVVTQIVIATASGAGSVTATAAGGASTGAAAGAGSVTDVVTLIAPATAAGAGAVADVVTQIAKATAAGAGAVTAAGQITGTASVAGAAAATAKATQAATATAAGTSVLSALAAQAATAVIAGAGSASAAGAVQLAFTAGTLTSATAAASTLTAATAPGAAAGGTLTAGDQRTGGPS